MKKILIVLLFMLLALAGLCGFAIYKNHNTGGYAINTVINGVDCSGLSASQAEKKLVGIWNRKGFKIVNEGKEIVYPEIGRASCRERV